MQVIINLECLCFLLKNNQLTCDFLCGIFGLNFLIAYGNAHLVKM